MYLFPHVKELDIVPENSLILCEMGPADLAGQVDQHFPWVRVPPWPLEKIDMNIKILKCFRSVFPSSCIVCLAVVNRPDVDPVRILHSFPKKWMINNWHSYKVRATAAECRWLNYVNLGPHFTLIVVHLMLWNGMRNINTPGNPCRPVCVGPGGPGSPFGPWGPRCPFSPLRPGMPGGPVKPWKGIDIEVNYSLRTQCTHVVLFNYLLDCCRVGCWKLGLFCE